MTKRPYSAPVLRRHGRVESLTKACENGPPDHDIQAWKLWYQRTQGLSCDFS